MFDDYPLPAQILAVQLVNGILGVPGILEFHKAVAAGRRGVAVKKSKKGGAIRPGATDRPTQSFQGSPSPFFPQGTPAIRPERIRATAASSSSCDRSMSYVERVPVCTAAIRLRSTTPSPHPAPANGTKETKLHAAAILNATPRGPRGSNGRPAAVGPSFTTSGSRHIVTLPAGRRLAPRASKETR